MTTHLQVSLGIIVALIVFPFLIVQAQSEMEATQQEPATEQIMIQEEIAPAAEETTVPAEETSSTIIEEGAILGESDEVVAEPVVSVESASTTPFGELPLDTASASPPVDDSLPIVYEEFFVLQPAVDFSVIGNTASANIVLENLTCKSCDKVLPDLDVVVYYTEWYPNDGPAKEYTQSSVRMMEETSTVSGLANWASREMTWSAKDVVPGKYYFVIEIDPENKNEAYRLYRSEFSI